MPLDSNQRDCYDAACSADSPACFTMRLIRNRTHDSRCPYAFVQSLAKTNFPGIQRSRVSWKIYDHEAFMKEQLSRVLSPVAFPQTRNLTQVRRQIEWQSGDPAIRDILFLNTSGHDSSVTELTST